MDTKKTFDHNLSTLRTLSIQASPNKDLNISTIHPNIKALYSTRYTKMPENLFPTSTRSKPDLSFRITNESLENLHQISSKNSEGIFF